MPSDSGDDALSASGYRQHWAGFLPARTAASNMKPKQPSARADQLRKIYADSRIFPCPIAMSFRYCSRMKKIRRKNEIRKRTQAECAALRLLADKRAAFLQPRPQSWHDVLFAALRRGVTVTVAAGEAGVTRAAVYKARKHEPGFGLAFVAAFNIGLSCRHSPSQRANGVTTIRTASTQKRRRVTLNKANSGLTPFRPLPWNDAWESPAWLDESSKSLPLGATLPKARAS